MRWFRKKLGRLTVEHMGHVLHTGRGFKTGCGVDVTATYFTILWNGVVKFSQVTSLEVKR